MRIMYFPISIVLLCTLKLAELGFVAYPEGYIYYDIDEIGGEGKYHVKWKLPDQQRIESTYPLKTANGDGYNGVEGYYAYSLGGKYFKVTFKADANGYHPKVELFKPQTPPQNHKTYVVNPDALKSVLGTGSGK